MLVEVWNVVGLCETVMSQPPPSFRFYTNLMSMKEPLTTIVAQCQKSGSIIGPDLVELAFGVLKFANHQEVLDTFVDRTHQHWELIAKTEDVSLVLNTALGAFQELGADRITEIQRMVKDKEVDPVLQKVLLDRGRSLVKIALRHLHAINSSLVNTRRIAKLYNLDLDAAPGTK